jgi:hypothetical protein
MSSKLDLLRKSLTAEQRCLIDTAFAYEQQHNNLAIPAVTLFDRCGGERIVSTALDALPANAIRSPPRTEGRRRYILTFLGYLLSSRGEELQRLLAGYLDHVRSKLQLDPELDRVDFAELKSEAGFTDDEFEFFREFIFHTPFQNGSKENGSGIPPNVDEWYGRADLYGYIAERALREPEPYIGKQAYISLAPLAAQYGLANAFDNRERAERPEINESLALFRTDHPDPEKVMFVIMRFGDTSLHRSITKAISDTLMPFGISPLRADGKRYHDELYYNILTYLYGCGSGVAVFERLEEETFNPNVAFEVGYMLALGKPVCLLKDRNLKTLPSDLAGKMYCQFDAGNLSTTISEELSRWLSDKNLIPK